MFGAQSQSGMPGLSDWTSDPGMVQKMKVAQALMGAAGRPAQSMGEGLANLGQSLVGAWMFRNATDDAKARQDAAKASIADALTMMQGSPARTETYGDGTTINWNARAPDSAAATRILANNQDLAPMAFGMLLDQGKAYTEAKAKIAAKAAEFGITPTGFDATGMPTGVKPIPGWNQGVSGFEAAKSGGSTSGTNAANYAQRDQLAATDAAKVGASEAARLPYDIAREQSRPQRVGSGESLIIPGGEPLATIPQLPGAIPGPAAPGTTAAPSSELPTSPVIPMIKKSALELGLNPALGLATAHIESGIGTASDTPGSKYTGVFQLGPDRVKQFGADIDYTTPQGQVTAGLRSLADTKSKLEPVLGRTPDPADVYGGHQQGVEGWAALVQAPRDAKAADVLAPFYKGGRNVAAIVGNLPTDMRNPDITAGEYVDYWRNRFNSHYARYGGKVTAGAGTTASDAPQTAPGGGGPRVLYSAPPKEPPGFEMENKLRSGFLALPPVKNYQEIVPVIQSLRESLGRDTSADDLNFVYGVAKIMDPGSVVREGESKMVVASGSPAERLAGTFNYVANGGRLTREQREKLLTTAESRYQAHDDAYRQIVGQYQKMAEDFRPYGVDPKRVVIDMAPKAPQTTDGPSQGVPTFSSPTDPAFQALPPGAMFKDGRGNLRRKS
jgi:hypothetical protein